MTNLYLQTDRKPSADWDLYREEFNPFKLVSLTNYNHDWNDIELKSNEIFNAGDIAYIVYVTYFIKTEYGWQIEYQYLDAFICEEEAENFAIELNNYRAGKPTSIVFEYNGNIYTREWMYFAYTNKRVHIEGIEIKE